MIQQYYIFKEDFFLLNASLSIYSSHGEETMYFVNLVHVYLLLQFSYMDITNSYILK